MAAGLNSLGIFGPPAMAPNVYNVVIIAAAIFLTPFFGIESLAIGVALGALGHVLTQTRPFLDRKLYRPVMDLNDPAVRQTLLLMGPRALGLGATQVVFLVYSMFTSTQPVGDVTIFNYSFMALQIPVGLLGVPLGIVLLPPLSRAFSLGQRDRFRGLADQSLRLLLFVTIPLTGLMLALATPTIAILYGYGKLTAAAQAAMVPVYIVFLAGLVAHVMISLLAPIFYAGKDTRTPVTAALVAVAVDIAAAVVLFPFFHLGALALAIGMGAWVEVVLLVTLMEKRIGFDLRPHGPPLDRVRRRGSGGFRSRLPGGAVHRAVHGRADLLHRPGRRAGPRGSGRPRGLSRLGSRLAPARAGRGLRSGQDARRPPERGRVEAIKGLTAACAPA